MFELGNTTIDRYISLWHGWDVFGHVYCTCYLTFSLVRRTFGLEKSLGHLKFTFLLEKFENWKIEMFELGNTTIDGDISL